MEEYLEAIGETKPRDSVSKITQFSNVFWCLVSRCSVIATMLRSASVRTRKALQLLTDADIEMQSRVYGPFVSGSVCEAVARIVF